jgi:signal transduction histidine kinase
LTSTRPTRTDAVGAVADRGIRSGWRSLAAVAGFSGTAATVLVALVPGLDTAFRSLTGNVAIDTAGAIAIALSAAIAAGRARRGARRTDLLLAAALVVTALSVVSFSLVPDLGHVHTRTLVTWAGAGTRLLAAALFLAAALGRAKAIERPQATIALGLLAAGAGAAAVTGLAALLSGALPSIHETIGPPHLHRNDLFRGPAGLTVAELLLTMALAAAATGFAIRAARRQDPLLAWMAAGVALLGVSRADYALFPSEFSNYIYIGDFIGLAGFLTLVAGAAVETLGAQKAVAEAAVKEERRRLARDLHDGLAQELAFITAQTRRLFGSRNGAGGGEELLAAAERALEESRLAISGLIRRGNEPLERTMTQAATSTAARAGVEVAFDIAPGIDVSPDVRQALLRVQSQAIVNAAVHGRARVVRIRLRAEPRLLLSVVDDGQGFDPAAPRRADSFGLASMEERAQALGGELKVESSPGAGTRIELVLP